MSDRQHDLPVQADLHEQPETAVDRASPAGPFATQMFSEARSRLGAGVLQRRLAARIAQRKAAGGAAAAHEESAAATADAPPKGGGASLPGDVRQKMESSFGADFGGVRVHEGGEASSMGALAFAQGNDLHFAPGQYNPGTQAGQQLLGHELAHVVQQREGRVSAPAQGKGAPVNEDPALEAEADAKGAMAAQGLPANAHQELAGDADEEFEYDDGEGVGEDDTEPEVEGEGGGGAAGAGEGAGEGAAEAGGAHAGGGGAATAAPAQGGGVGQLAVGHGVAQPFRGRTIDPVQLAKSNFADKKKNKYFIYEVTEKGTQRVVYRGQTLASVGIKTRFKQHCRQKKWKAKHYRIRKIDEGKWTTFEACCFEQWYIEKQGMQFLTFNKINAITRKKFNMYKKHHKDLPFGWKPAN